LRQRRSKRPAFSFFRRASAYLSGVGGGFGGGGPGFGVGAGGVGFGIGGSVSGVNINAMLTVFRRVCQGHLR